MGKDPESLLRSFTWMGTAFTRSCNDVDTCLLSSGTSRWGFPRRIAQNAQALSEHWPLCLLQRRQAHLQWQAQFAAGAAAAGAVVAAVAAANPSLRSPLCPRYRPWPDLFANTSLRSSAISPPNCRPRRSTSSPPIAAPATLLSILPPPLRAPGNVGCPNPAGHLQFPDRGTGEDRSTPSDGDLTQWRR